jgi:hypothetical protein
MKYNIFISYSGHEELSTIDKKQYLLKGSNSIMFEIKNNEANNPLTGSI